MSEQVRPDRLFPGRITIDQFNELAPDDGVVRELLDGVVYVRGSARNRHNRVITRLARLWGPYEDEHGGVVLAPGGGTILSERDGVIPDAAYVRPERAHIVEDVDTIGPPDLVVEVLSPGNRGYDLVRKRERYERTGVPELWFVDLEAERIEVLRRGETGHYGHPRILGRGETIDTPAMPGWSCQVDEILGPPAASQDEVQLDPDPDS